MSYHLSTSLSEQVANLADVYSQVRVLPTARDEILRNSRMGTRPKDSPIDLTSLMTLVDAFIAYRYVWWDPASPAMELTNPYLATPRTSLFTAWRRRKCRLQSRVELGAMPEPTPELIDSDAPHYTTPPMAPRILAGHSSPEPYTEKIWVSNPWQGADFPRYIGWPYAIHQDTNPLEFDVYVVYADGSIPSHVEMNGTPDVVSRNYTFQSHSVSGNRIRLEFSEGPAGDGYDDHHVVIDLKFIAWEETPWSEETPLLGEFQNGYDKSPVVAHGQHTLILDTVNNDSGM